MPSLTLLVALCPALAASDQPAQHETKPTIGDNARFAQHVERLRMEKLSRDLWAKPLGDKPMPTERLDLIGAAIGERMMLDAGGSEITALRNEDKARRGAKFSLRDFCCRR